ncbi:MAG TPA: hypothetical protein VLA19_09580 [Herpetosiphonaceae bacterium]|uniref:SWIM-type domain-containing protein n=1 Tax=uncultured Chloroflexia bacterium TaxID=1672391 RepID=A0A6J4JRW3_9CHLR|nr:MAG: hypothetical protein AVDCRST_MAG26-3723 [uncultured Chloroflexia bacterium]HSH78766.1 hypothetical protein [Herpetosiphonaceae bacterium]
MHSDLIGKIEKAKRYAQEPERFAVEKMTAHFRGGSSDHAITLDDDQWSCDCNFFRTWQTCSHIMAVQRILAPMLSSEAKKPAGPPYVSERLIEAAG